MKKFFVILSSGAYSDYSPTYYMGDVEITKDEFTKKGDEVGDKLWEKFESLPERKDTSGYTLNADKMERYNPKTGEIEYPPDDIEFEKIMEKWLLEEKGYEKLPDNIPEINVYYDVPRSNPHTKNEERN